MNCRVLIETSTLVSASVYAVVKGVTEDLQLKHPYFEKCTDLMTFIGQHTSEDIGITTNLIEREAKHALQKAALLEVRKRGESAFKNLSIILNQCDDRFNGHLEILRRDPVDQEEVNKQFVNVSRMYDGLGKTAQYLDPRRIRLRAKATARFQASPRYRGIKEDLQRNELHEEYGQIRSLIGRKPSANDIMIVAQAAVLSKKYRGHGVKQFFLASTDVQMSPVTDSAGNAISSGITEEIQKQFEVICDWPDRIARELRRSL